MKRFSKLIGIIAIITLSVFMMMACDEGSPTDDGTTDGPPGDGGTPATPLPPAEPVVITDRTLTIDPAVPSTVTDFGFYERFDYEGEWYNGGMYLNDWREGHWMGGNVRLSINKLTTFIDDTSEAKISGGKLSLKLGTPKVISVSQLNSLLPEPDNDGKFVTNTLVMSETDVRALWFWNLTDAAGDYNLTFSDKDDENFINIIYVEKDVELNGVREGENGKINFVNISLKQGWNFLQGEIEDIPEKHSEKYTKSFTTLPADATVKLEVSIPWWSFTKGEDTMGNTFKWNKQPVDVDNSVIFTGSLNFNFVQTFNWGWEDQSTGDWVGHTTSLIKPLSDFLDGTNKVEVTADGRVNINLGTPKTSALQNVRDMIYADCYKEDDGVVIQTLDDDFDFTISNWNAKIFIITEFITNDYNYYLNYRDVYGDDVYINYVYVDNDVTINGGYVTHYGRNQIYQNISLKKGWNIMAVVSEMDGPEEYVFYKGATNKFFPGYSLVVDDTYDWWDCEEGCATCSGKF